MRVKPLGESAGPVVDGFAAECGVVRVHDAVHEPVSHPLRNQFELLVDDHLQQPFRGIESCGVHDGFQELMGLGRGVLHRANA